MKQNRSYLGDGLYAEDDGFMITLTAPRENGEHFVGLEPEVLVELFRFIEKKRNVIIHVEQNKGDNE